MENIMARFNTNIQNHSNQESQDNSYDNEPLEEGDDDDQFYHIDKQDDNDT